MPLPKTEPIKEAQLLGEGSTTSLHLAFFVFSQLEDSAKENLSFML